MLKAIRNIKWGWIIALMGIVMIVSGISMLEAKEGEKTFLCFESGCVYIQGVSSIMLGILFLGFGVFRLFKK